MTPYRVWMGLVVVLALGGLQPLIRGGEDWVAGLVVSLAMAALVAVAWWRPLAACVAALAVCAAQVAVGNPLYDLSLAVFSLAAMIGMAAAREAGARVWLALALGTASVVCVLVPSTDQAPGDGLFAALFIVGLPALLGRMFRSRSRLDAELREQARRLAADRQARAEEAAATERRRIAGELHDLVAHGVSGMTVQAEAARRLARSGDPRAEDAIRAVEDAGRESLAELRRLLGVLRRDDADLALAPQPSLARVDALVAQLRADGLDVRLEVEGERVGVSPGVDVAGYRVVEEALRGGAAGPVAVSVHYRPRHVDVSITGVAPEAADIVGLRERVRLFGGEIVPTRRAGVPALRAHLPLTGSAT